MKKSIVWVIIPTFSMIFFSFLGQSLFATARANDRQMASVLKNYCYTTAIREYTIEEYIRSSYKNCMKTVTQIYADCRSNTTDTEYCGQVAIQHHQQHGNNRQNNNQQNNNRIVCDNDGCVDLNRLIRIKPF